MQTFKLIEEAVLNFVKGGDNRDVNLLDKALHNDFRVTNNGFMGKPGITVITREQYLDNIKAGVFGGLPREVSIELIDVIGSIAIVKIRLESSENSFISYNSLVEENDGSWKIVNNLAVVKAKNA